MNVGEFYPYKSPATLIFKNRKQAHADKVGTFNFSVSG